MSDSEEENPNESGSESGYPDEGPSTSWGTGRKSGIKRKLLVDSDDEEEDGHHSPESPDEETDDEEDGAGDNLEGFTHTSSQLMQSMGIVINESA